MKMRVYGEFIVSVSAEFDVPDDVESPEDWVDEKFERARTASFVGNGSSAGIVGLTNVGIAKVTLSPGELEITTMHREGDDGNN